MRSLLFVLVLAFGCKQSPSSQPTPPPPAPANGSAPGSAACGAIEPGAALTPEQCTCLGGRVNLSRGGEQEHCEAKEQEIGNVRVGIEGGWCCKAQ